MSDQPDHEHGGLGKLTSGKFNRGRATIDNENGSHSIVITSSSDLTTTDDPGPSSGMRDKNSTTAGFVTAGDGATTIVNNPNVIVAGSNGKHEKEVIPYLIPPEPQHHASQHMTLRLDHHAGYPNIFVNPGAQLNIYSDQPKSTSEENQIKTILKTIHNITWMKTSTSIGETFKRDRFSEPDFEVHPQIVESPNFYQGGHQVKGAHTSNESGRRKNKVEVREAEYKKGSELALQMPSSSLPSTLPNPLPMQTSLSLLPFHLHRKTKHEIEQQQKRKLKLKNEYKKDTKFTFNAEHDQDSNFISGESLMEKIHEKKDKPGVLGVVAQAGAGKTTCMRRRARYTMEKNGITRENDFTPSENSRFQLILFIEMKSIEFSDDTSLGNFLFQDILEDDDDVKIARKWLNQNQDKCVIFFDGLDQAHQAITDDDMNQCNPASTSSILTKLLTRHLLPGTRIIISSREHSATSLPEEAWFDDVITLTGFTEEDAKKLFNAITAESCDTDDCDISDQNLTNWDKLSKTSSALLTFISVPVILLFTAIVFNLYDAAPSSLTDLMAKVIESLQYTLNTRKRKQIWPIINKLKRLSHEGMEKGLVIFSEGDLTNRYLKIDDVRDLLLMVSRSKSLSRRFIEGDNVFFFCHQILQEFLSACFIVEMSLTKFKDFVQMELNKNHWSIVRRFVCGLIFSKSPNEELVEISDEIEKQKILRENLIHLLNESMDDHVPKHKLAEKLPLELYAAIYESEDDSVIRAIQQINLTAYPGLSQDALRMIGSLIATSRMLESFTVGSGNIKQHLSILTDCMKDFTVQIKMVYVDWQFVKNPPEFAYLDKFLQRVDSDKVVLRRKETPWFDFTDGGADCKRYPELAAQCIVEGVVLDNRTDYDFIKLWLYFGKTAEKYLGVYKRSDSTLKINPVASDLYRYDIVMAVATAVNILGPRIVTFQMQEKLPPQKLRNCDLRMFQNCEVDGQIDVEEVNVDCRSYNDEISGEEISPLVCFLQVRILTVVVTLKQINKIHESLRQELLLLNCELKIHVDASDDFSLQKLSGQIRGRQISRLDIRLPRSTGTKKDLILLIENLKEAKELWVDCAPVHIETAKSWLADPYTKKLILDAVKSAGIILKLIKGLPFEVLFDSSTSS